MIPFENIRTIFFDYDGTLHNCLKIYAPAFRKAYSCLVEEGLAKEREWSDQEIGQFIGFNAGDIWDRILPGLADGKKRRFGKFVGDEMMRLVSEGKAELYEGALEVLSYLKAKGLHLVFLSNCRSYYKEGHRKAFLLDQYFEELACSEDYRDIQKSEILSRIKKKYPGEMVMIGDRIHDMEAGKNNGIYTIGCSYGFPAENELNAADLVIDDITYLKRLF